MKPATRSFYEQAVQRVIERIAGGLDEALDLETLAGEACLSPFHFHRVFRGMVGETPVELVRRLRLERAALRLATTGTPITEIAFDAGYETHEAFTRAFRSYYNASPSGFRRQGLRRIEIPAPCGVHYDAAGRVPAFIPRDSGGRTMHVEIKQRPALRVAAVRHTGPYNQIAQAFARLGAVADAAGLVRHASEMVAIYYDDPESVPLDQLRSDAGLVVPDDVALPDGLGEQRIAGGRYACALHVGPYEQLGDIWSRFMGEWLPSSGHRVAEGPAYEIYRNTPMDTPKEQLRTEMYVPLA